MSDLTRELDEIEAKAKAIYAKWNTKSIRKSLKNLHEAALDAENAHSGSWMGYHSCVYYNNLERPPPGTFFDRQWGLQGRYSTATVGDWVKYTYADIYDHLKNTPAKPTFVELSNIANEFAPDLDDVREDLLSVIEACRAVGNDDYLDRMRDEATKARMTAPDKFAKSQEPARPPMTNDLTAAAGGFPVPPHAAFRAFLQSIASLFDSAEDLSKIAKRTATYLSKREKAKTMLNKAKVGTKVFIGHGHSNAWLELKNYIQDSLGLQCDDFEREPTAGLTTVARLTRMLDDACFAFLVLTGEDELKSGEIIARLNVIHEAGLFQARLGFEKAILMLESGCEEFSNVHGLTHIPFEKGKIKGAFHKVSGTLKREGLA